MYFPNNLNIKTLTCRRLYRIDSKQTELEAFLIFYLESRIYSARFTCRYIFNGGLSLYKIQNYDVAIQGANTAAVLRRRPLSQKQYLSDKHAGERQNGRV